MFLNQSSSGPATLCLELQSIFKKPSACYKFCLIHREAACMKNKGEEHSAGKGSLFREIWPILCSKTEIIYI